MLRQRRARRPSDGREGRAKTRDKEHAPIRNKGPASRSQRVAETRRKMAKRKGPSTSRPRARNKAAKEGTEAKACETGVDDDKEFHQLTRELLQLEGKRAKLSEKEQELGDKLEEEEALAMLVMVIDDEDVGVDDGVGC